MENEPKSPQGLDNSPHPEHEKDGDCVVDFDTFVDAYMANVTGPPGARRFIFRTNTGENSDEPTSASAQQFGIEEASFKRIYSDAKYAAEKGTRAKLKSGYTRIEWTHVGILKPSLTRRDLC